MKKKSPLFLVLLASVSLVGPYAARAEEAPAEESAVAETAVAEGDETIDAEDEFADDETMAVADLGATQSCVENVCVGMYVKVTSGEFVGQEGAVVGIDDGNDTATLVNAKGEYVYPLLKDLTAQNAMNWDGCFAGVCIGDKVKLKSGQFKGKKGRVTGLNTVNATAIVLVKRKHYVTIAIADLKVKRREVYSEPYPVRRYYRHYRSCGYDSVFDAYRGCVRVIRIYHPIPVRRVIVRHPVPRPPRPRVIIRPSRPPHHPGTRPTRPVVVRPTRPTRPTTPARPTKPSRPTTAPSRPTPSRPTTTRPTPSRRSTAPSRPTPSRPSAPSRPSSGGVSRPSAPSRPSSGGVSRPSPSSRPSSAPSRPSRPRG